MKHYKLQSIKSKSNLTVKLINVSTGRVLAKSNGLGHDKLGACLEIFLKQKLKINFDGYLNGGDFTKLHSILDRNGWRLVYATTLADGHNIFLEIETKRYVLYRHY